MSEKTKLLFLLLLASSVCDGYKILALFPYNGKSHMNVLQHVTKALAEKGHQVDVVSHFPLKKKLPNYTDIVTLPKVDDPATMDFQMFSSRKSLFKEIHNIMVEMCEYLELPKLSKLIENQRRKTTYDVILIHYLFGHQCFTGIGHLLSVPVIGIITSSLSTPMNTFVGNPLNLALPPCKHCSQSTSSMTFWERLNNVLMTRYEIYNFHESSKDQQLYINKYLGPDVPHYTDLEKSISLLLTNSHFSYNGVKPKVPAVVEIGGIHIKNNTEPMEPSFKKILDDSKNGFIFFSFGSMVKLETFPADILEKFYKTFQKLSPIRIIIRVAKPELMPKYLPSNVYTYPWLPQQQIFQHPKLKGFVTHGGVHSTHEAIYHAVPMICMPFYADQSDNCNILVGKKLALKLDFRTAQQKDYDYAFEQISSNPIYRESAKKVSILFRDRPRSPTEEAVYWIEYVTRHGKNVLRSPSVDLNWWHVENIDVYAFITTSLLVTLVVMVYLTCKVFKNMRLWMKFYRAKDIYSNKKKLK